MSHFARVMKQFKNRSAMVKALKRVLGDHSIEQGESLELSTYAGRPSGLKVQIRMRFNYARCADLGVEFNADGTCALHFDTYHNEAMQADAEWEKHLNQEYSVVVLQQEAQELGQDCEIVRQKDKGGKQHVFVRCY